ncbi:T9SS type A sorting domain-containing protein [bacterium]|nr:T9SS type A sorting domain-containing protein [bacterium]
MRNKALLFAALAIALAITAFGQEWEIPFQVYTNPDSARVLVAKTSIYGSELYDSTVVVGVDSFTIDKAAPPAPPSGLSVFFPLDDPTYFFIDRLMIDGRSSAIDTLIWTIQWGGATAMDIVTVEWDPAGIPADAELLIDTTFLTSTVDWSSAQNMSLVSSVMGNGMLNKVQMRFTRVVPDVDTLPPYFTNWNPADGAIDVPETTTTLSVDIIDAMSPIDESSITLDVAGFSVPSMFLDISDISGGKRVTASTGGMISLPPGSTIVCIACAADSIGNDACDTANFTIHDTVTTIWCVEGTVSVGGESDLSGSIVIVGAYHDSTDASGYYHVCAPENSYILYVLSFDGRNDSLDIDLDSDQTHNFSFPAIIGSISGTVFLDGASDHSGTVVAELVSGFTTTTDVAGDYMLDDCEIGTVRVSASHSGYETKVDTFDLTSDTTGIDFLLFPVTMDYDITGTITLEGMTIHSATNVNLSDGLSYDEDRTTNGAGYFAFNDVPEGGYTLTATHTDFESWDTTITVNSDLDINRELAEAPSVYYNPPSNLQSTTRPCWPGAFNLITWDPPMMADTVKLAHCSARGYGDTRWGGFSMYYGYGWAGGGYAMPFVAPRSGMTLSKIRMAMHPSSYGVNSLIGIWEEDPDSGGPGDIIWSSTVALNDTSDGWVYIDVPAGILVGTDLFFVGWNDPTDTDVLYVMYDYTSPDTLAWVHNAYDSSWSWEGDNVNMADGDFAVECYVSGGARSHGELSNMEMIEALQSSKVSHPDRAKALADFHPKSLDGPNVDLFSVTSVTPRLRPSELPNEYLLYRHTSPFTDTTVAEFVTSLPDTSPYYLDMDDIDDVTYYYGIVAVYPTGVSEVSVLGKGYNRNPPAGTNVLLIDWCGGPQLDTLGWEWDSSDSLVALLGNAGFTGDSLLITGEQERLYGYFFTEDDTTLYDLIVITWSPLSSSGWLGPRMRGPEWRKLDDYLRCGGNLFIEGADAMEMLSGDGYATNQYDSLYSQFGVSFLDGGSASLDTGNVRQLTGNPTLFSLADTVDYSLATISDFGLDEFEHQMGSGATTVLWSQLISPIPHATNGRGVWMNAASYKTYVQSPYFGAVIDIPTVGSNEILFDELLDGFGVNPAVPEKKASLPGEMTLYANVPNPFNATTEVFFNVTRTGEFDLSIFDMMGKKVTDLATGVMPAGMHRVIWDGRDAIGNDAESGIYFYRLKGDAGEITKRMILLK